MFFKLNHKSTQEIFPHSAIYPMFRPFTPFVEISYIRERGDKKTSIYFKALLKLKKVYFSHLPIRTAHFRP
jgi:hypothetical protein